MTRVCMSHASCDLLTICDTTQVSASDPRRISASNAIGIHTQNMFDTDTLVYINLHVCRWR